MTKKERDRAYYLRNRSRIIAKSKLWAEQNPEKRKQITDRWNNKHPGLAKRRANEWYLDNKERHLKNTAKWQKENPDKCRKYTMSEKSRKKRQEYRKNNRLKILQTRRMAEKQKLKTDPCYRIQKSIRNRILKFLGRGDKKGRSLSLLGCSIEKFRSHIEQQWKAGMTWNNYGEWHIDHIRPCSSFNLLLAEDQKKCFHWSNQQPLWAKDNLKKGSRWFKSSTENTFSADSGRDDPVHCPPLKSCDQ